MRTRGEGVKKSEIFADVIYGSPVRVLSYMTFAENKGKVGPK